MYNFIIGKVAHVTNGSIVLENNGIGYEIGVSGNTLADCGEIGRTVKIHTFLYVKEDVFALYGFSKLEEKTLFLRLIDISGIGPKLAMQILSGMELGSLIAAIATGDVKTLSKIKGLGKKTAELIVVSMRDNLAGELASASPSVAGITDEDKQGAIYALVSLGISNTDAVRLVNEAAKQVSGAENIISEVLKQLG